MKYYLLAMVLIAPVRAEDLLELEKLDDLYKKEIKRVTAPVNQKYETALERLQKSYATANLLDEALAVRTELNTFLAKKKSAKKADIETTKEEDGSNNIEAKKALRRWKGGGRLIAVDDEFTIQIKANSGKLKIENTFEVKGYPDGMDLKFSYRTSDYVGEGLKLKGYYTRLGYHHRTITFNADGKWHEYTWPYPSAQYLNAAQIRMVLEVLSGKGSVNFKGFELVKSIKGG